MEPFKNQFNPQVIRLAASHLKRAWAGFDSESFVAEATDGLDSLELKQRSAQIAAALAAHLPSDWAEASSVLVGALGTVVDPDAPGSAAADDTGVRGFMIMPFCEAVVLRGMDEPKVSLAAFKEMTKRFSAEFAVRPFFVAHPELTCRTFESWIADPSPHVRRLVSEGSRTRLPWSLRLHAFIEDPTRTIGWLRQLVDDESEYVRRSVANHLGDLAKDHPERAVALAREWSTGGPSTRAWVVKHGLRWLLKQGHPGALDVLGYGPAKASAELALEPSHAAVGGALQLVARITSLSDRVQPLMIDYRVWHVKADGGRTPKVFKWTTRDLAGGKTVTVRKKHSLKPVTTRRYYPGTHRLEVQVNGEVVCGTDFELRSEG